MNASSKTPPMSVNLSPGELYFGEAPGVVHTLLGSCVAITLWHKERKVGGMCHFLLAQRDLYLKNSEHPQGYYGSDAIRYFAEEILRKGLSRKDFEVKLFGGGNMFEATHFRPNLLNVSNNNVEQGRILLEKHGFKIKTEDVGGVRYRKIFFDLSNGDVWVKYGKHTKSTGVNTA